LVSEASASTVTQPGEAAAASQMNCAAVTPQGDEAGAPAPVLPRPAGSERREAREHNELGGVRAFHNGPMRSARHAPSEPCTKSATRSVTPPESGPSAPCVAQRKSAATGQL
jgi:hypothetical protein